MSNPTKPGITDITNLQSSSRIKRELLEVADALSCAPKAIIYDGLASISSLEHSVEQLKRALDKAISRNEALTQRLVDALLPSEIVHHLNGRNEALTQLLVDANEIAIVRGDQYGLCDSIDNGGHMYQSQCLADLLNESK